VASSCSVQILISGAQLSGGSDILFARTVALSAPTGAVQTVNLNPTPAPATIPSGSTFLLVVPPTGNTSPILLGGAGVAAANMATLSPNLPTLVSLSASSPSVVLAASPAVTGVTLMAF